MLLYQKNATINDCVLIYIESHRKYVVKRGRYAINRVSTRLHPLLLPFLHQYVQENQLHEFHIHA